MRKSTFLSRLLTFTLFFSLCYIQLFAQSFAGIKVQENPASLSGTLAHAEVYEINLAALNAHVKSNVNYSVSELNFGDHHWKLSLSPSKTIYPGTYSIREQNADGSITTTYPMEQIAFQGYDQLGYGKTRITLTEDVLYGYVRQGNLMYYFEPLWYYEPDAARNLVVVYERGDVVPNASKKCGVTEADEAYHNHAPDRHEDEHADNSMACYEIELAIASDVAMVSDFGSASAVATHNVGVINNVQGDYTGNFNHDIEFNIVTQFIAAGSNPWTATTDAGQYLANFRGWGNSGGFGVPFDLGELWTGLNLDGSTIGIAYLNGLCNNNKYHVLSNFSSNEELVRCMTSHEIGHNLTAVHDGAGACPPNFIMCPFVSTATQWSTGSQSSINSYIQTKINSGCLQLCGPPPAPLVADFEWNPDPGCAGQPVQFSNLSSGNITGYNWQFPGAAPAASSQQNPTATWANGGTYNVVLTLSGVGGPVSITKAVTITPKPVANFTSSVSGTTVSFNSTSTNATMYNWDFGDGFGFSDLEDPVYTYATGGIYTVVLTVTNACGTSTKTTIINTAPTAEFSANPTSGCAALVVQFSNESSNNASTYSWSFPGGSPVASNQANPTVVYQNSGTFSVTLVAGNGSGTSTVVKTNYITVQNLPGASFSSAATGLSVAFTNTSANATSYAWNFGEPSSGANNTSTLQNPTHVYATGGTYTVTLTTSNICGSVTATQTVNLGSPPAAAFTATPSSGCGPLTVQFNNTTTGNASSYAWQFPGGSPATSTAQNPTVVYATPGIYSVTLTATNGSGSNTATQTNIITVNTTPTPSFSSTTSGSTASFTNASSNATAYAWNFGEPSSGANNSSTAANPTHTYAADGTYTVTLTATNACGSVTTTQTVSIVTPPTAAFTATNTNGCAPLTVQFTSTSSTNSATYAWQFAGGNPATSTAQNPTVVYATPGTYGVTLTVSNAAGSNTATQTNIITVNTTPTPSFSSTTSGLTATFTNASTNATAYAWNFGEPSSGANNSSTAANPTHTYAADGTYTVTLTATNACGSVTTTQTVSIVTPPTAAFTATNTNGCAPLTVQFTSTSSTNSATYAWQFAGGNPATSTAQNPTVVYALPGTYGVTLTVSNAAGSNTATQASYVTVNTTPSTSFSSTTSGSTATFTNASTNATSYAWNFGEPSSGANNTSSSANPTHTYAADGTYTVTLTTTNACGSTSFTQNVVIITSPNAGFTANTTSGCPGLMVQFTDLSSSNTTAWAWTFPGGNPATSTAQNPVVTYTTPGTYNVSLVATGPGGNSTFSQSNFITVFNLPSAQFTSGVTGSTATFANNSANATAYSWNFGDNSSSAEANPTHTYAADGTYTVSLTAINNCGAATFEQTVTITTVPSAAFTANQTSGCAPLTVQFTNQSSDNTTSYNWTFEGGFPASSTEQNPSATWANPGTYTVTLITSNLAGNDTASTQIIVNGPPAASFTTQLAGLAAVFTNTSTNATVFLWNFGDGSSSSSANPTHTYASAGTYTVTLQATNACGTTVTTAVVEIVGAPPAPAFTSNITSGCPPITIQFTDNSAGTPTAWAWSFPGGSPATSADQNPSVTYNAPGTYDVTLQATNAFGSNTTTSTSYVTVNAAPVSAFTFTTSSGMATFTNQAQNATGFQWNFGDGSPISNEANPIHTYAATGTYTVELTVTNPCGAATLQQMIQVVVSGVDGITWLEDLKVYPNPNNGVFTLEMRGASRKEVELWISNPLGQQIARETLDFGSGTATKVFNYADMPKGLYHLQIRAAGSVVNVKVAVQ